MSRSKTNCTVAFMSKCMSMGKCKQSCKSMGAAKYRWFHAEGCCQCIGDTCIDYGLNEAMCLLCHEDSDDDDASKHSEKDGITNGEHSQREGIAAESELERDEKIVEQEIDGISHG